MLAGSSDFRSPVVGSRKVFSKLLRAFNPIQTERSSLVVVTEREHTGSAIYSLIVDWPLRRLVEAATSLNELLKLTQMSSVK